MILDQTEIIRILMCKCDVCYQSFEFRDYDIPDLNEKIYCPICKSLIHKEIPKDKNENNSN